jgi:hypothetical protein
MASVAAADGARERDGGEEREEARVGRDGETGRRRDGETGRRGDGETARRGDGEKGRRRSVEAPGGRDGEAVRQKRKGFKETQPR